MGNKSERNKEKKKDFYKIILIGDSGVGKTSIINRFVLNKFISEIKKINAYTKIIKINESKNLKLQIVDTFGQERFRLLPKYYYLFTDIAILVYDSTSKSSFESIKNEWYRDLINYSPKDIGKN